jgi:hypothetical protein
MDYDINIHPRGENVNGLEMQSRDVGNLIAYGMMHKPDKNAVNHKGHDCILSALPSICEHGYCSGCPVKSRQHMLDIEQQNAQMTRGY